jgi:hypothetical protein
MNLGFFCDNRSEKNEHEVALQIWNIIEVCSSLQSVGWVGEAGAMAIAAEALGLGISTHDQLGLGVGVSSISGIISISGNDDETFPTVLLAAGGISQVLSSVQTINSLSCHTPGSSFAACAEAALGGDGGGVLVFLRRGIQGALSDSMLLRRILIATIRRSVRMLAVIEFPNDEGTSSASLSSDVGDEEDVIERSRNNDFKSNASSSSTRQTSPDPWLISFLTGLLLSDPQYLAPEISETTSLPSFSANLLEAWSVGLLSASAPWRMVCALTVSSILNMFPQCLPIVLTRIPTLNRLFGRLESTVVRRVWAERAAVPVCSKYTQAYIELLSSVRRSKRLFSPDVYKSSLPLLMEDISVDAATPLPLGNVSHEDCKSDINVFHSKKNFEWNEGWVTCDAGWEVWTGSVEIMSVDWITPLRSAVRTLMDGGEGPPMLREGCTVVRGLD